MTTTTMRRPLPPSLIRQLADFLALSDPRCGSEDHGMITRGFACPACHYDRTVYVDMAPKYWGEA